MTSLTAIGPEFEAIILAVVFFLAGGIVSFACCFMATHSYLCYKRRMLRKRGQHDEHSQDYEWEKDSNSAAQGTFTYQPLVGGGPPSSTFAPKCRSGVVAVSSFKGRIRTLLPSSLPTRGKDVKLKRANTIATAPSRAPT